MEDNEGKKNISVMSEEDNLKNNNNQKKKHTIIFIVIFIILIGAILLVAYLMNHSEKESNNNNGNNSKDNASNLSYRLSGNALNNFDLYFLQEENQKENKLYSPISIKYALKMLEEGAYGTSKEQLSNVLGTYYPNKYVNSANMSFANGMFIKNSYQNAIKNSYINSLSDKYNAEVIYDSFATPDVLNTWVKNKTFQMIDKVSDNISNQEFILANALAIDMEWKNQINSDERDYDFGFAHTNYYQGVGIFGGGGMTYRDLAFEGLSKKVNSVPVVAVINKYDIVDTLGEDKIRETVGNEYQKWLDEGAPDSCDPIEALPDKESYVDQYIKEIDKGYQFVGSSTDFYFHTDDDVKVFAKDLKEYDGVALQYVGIMPKKGKLTTYIKNMDASKINTLIDNLKTIEIDNFKEGVVTEIKGYIPMFKFDYELNLIEDLEKLGISDVFDADKADLSNISTTKASISDVTHKTAIEFSNDGIKAAAVTVLGGMGDGGCGFDYRYELPVEKIDITFDRPYLFFIRDKKTGEIWFTGTVYEPTTYENLW